MAMLADRVLDNGLQVLIDDGEELWISSLSSDSLTYATVLAAKLGEKAAPSISLADGVTNGRRALIAAITDGVVEASGTARRWHIVNTSSSEVLSCQTLTAEQAVTSGNPFTAPAQSITIPDPA